MSQPAAFRQILDDVVENVRVDFDEMGVEEAVLLELLRSWEFRVAASRVADFTTDPKMAATAKAFPMKKAVLPPTQQPAAGAGAVAVKNEAAAVSPLESRVNNRAHSHVSLSLLPSSQSPASRGATPSTSTAATAVKPEQGTSGSSSAAADPAASATTTNNPDDEINSDLDDPDDDLDDEGDDDGTGGEPDGDIVIALYEKVNTRSARERRERTRIS